MYIELDISIQAIALLTGAVVALYGIKALSKGNKHD